MKNYLKTMDLKKLPIVFGIIAVVCFMILFSAKTTNAQTKVVLNQNTPSPILPTKVILTTTNSVLPTQTISNNHENELDILNAKLDVISEYNDRMMTTVQWSLGIVITILIVFLGLNWFTTYQQFKKDIESLEKITSENINGEIKKAKLNISNDLNEKFNALKDQNREFLSYEFSSIKEKMIDIQLDQMEQEAKNWEIKKVFPNVITCYINMILLKPNHSTIQFTLGNIEAAINNCSKKLSSYDVDKIEYGMNLLEDQHKMLIDRIVLAIKKNNDL